MWYPHKLFIVQSEIIKDPITKEWIEPNSAEQEISSCKEQVNGAGKQINGADGQTIAFNSVIYLPLSSPDLKIGDEVLVYSDSSKNHLRIRGKVLRFSRETMHCRLWV